MNMLTNKYIKWLNGNIGWFVIVGVVAAILVIVGGFVMVSTYAIDRYFELPPEDRPDIIPDIDIDPAMIGGAVGIGLLLVVILMWSRKKGGD